MRAGKLSFLAVLVTLLAQASCGGMHITRFASPSFNFSYVQKVAVLPFENLSSDQQAGARATRLFITELLAAGAVDVVEPGEVQSALSRIAGVGGSPSVDQVIALAKSLGVQAVITGSVNESTTMRSGTVQVPVVTLDVHMLDGETGKPVWAATNTEKGSGAGAQFLGTGGEPISETTRRCIQHIVHELVR